MYYIYIGAAPLVILGTTFLDDQLDKHASSTYIAVFQTLFVVGPAVGYVVGGMMLSQHTGTEYSCSFWAVLFYQCIYLHIHSPSSRTRFMVEPTFGYMVGSVLLSQHTGTEYRDA